MKTERFEFRGHQCVLICPEAPADGNPWVWRAEFLGAFDYADKALLDKGWHIAYCQLVNQYGCEYAVEEMKYFHDYLVSEYSLSKKADIFGFSRGGLYTFNYSVKYPEDISVVYLDAPVLDIRSWPAGFGKSTRCVREWRECLECYHLTEDMIDEFKGSPIYRLDDLISTELPVILVAGDSDIEVPYDENGAFLAEKLKDKGSDCLIIIKPDVGHHPHSLSEPAELVDFIINHRV